MSRKLMFLTALAFIATAAPAAAAERWASPGGSGTACTQASPCSLATASDDLNTIAGDEIIVTPGSYMISGISIFDTGIEIHGQDGQPRPTITMTGSFGLYLFSATKVRDLNLVTTSFTAFGYFDPGSVIERVTATATSAGAVPCQLATSITIRDTICRSTGTNGVGIGGNFGLLSGSHLLKLRNVTAVGTAAGMGMTVSGSGVDFDLDAKNVIAQAGASGTDVTVTAESGAAADVVLANSNYATKTQFTNNGGTSVSVTNPGTGTNQTAEPVFVNAAAGDFHQAASSPTIDAGVLDADVGTNDFEGDPRTLEGNGSCPSAPVPDIGADERAGAIDCPSPPDPPVLPAGDSDPPETTITKAPKRKIKSKRTKAKVSASFSSDEPGGFQCSIDGGAFSPCASSFSFKAKKGKHTLAVRAVDTAGNVDPTPATAPFKVKVKKKR